MSDDLRERFAMWEEIRDAIRVEIQAWGYTAEECPLESLSADLASAVMNTVVVAEVKNRAFLNGKDLGRREAIDDLIEYLQETR